MKRLLFCLLTIFACSLGVSCNADKPVDTPAENSAEKPAEKSTELSKVRLKTNKGDILIELNADKAPVTVENFKKYVGAGHYNGTVFHRVIDGFMIQGGGFANQDGKLVEKKTGEEIVNESKNGLKNEIGTIAMARRNDPNSATAQFFINVSNNNNLDFPSLGGYAVFGKVIEGMDVVNQIKAVQTGVKELMSLSPNGQLVPNPSRDVPLAPIIIESAILE